MIGTPVTVPQPSGSSIFNSATGMYSQPGSYYFTAEYSGDPTDSPATSLCETLTVLPATSSTTTTSTAPSGGVGIGTTNLLILVGVVVVLLGIGGYFIMKRGRGGPPPKTGETPPPPPPPPPPGVGVAAPTIPPCLPGTRKTEVVCSCDVNLYIPSMAQVTIGGVYLAGVEDMNKALDGLQNALSTASIATGLLGLVTDPIASFAAAAGTWAGWAGLDIGTTADDITGKPTDAAMKGLNRLAGDLKNLRRSGYMSITVPQARFRFFCEVTKECRNGYWVVIDRSLKLRMFKKLAPYTYPESPVQVTWQNTAQGNAEIDHIMGSFATKMKQMNQDAQNQMLGCEKACQDAT